MKITKNRRSTTLRINNSDWAKLTYALREYIDILDTDGVDWINEFQTLQDKIDKAEDLI